MKKKLYMVLVEIASLAILLTIVCVSVLFYKGFEKQVLGDLELITETYSLLSLEQIQEMENNEYLQKNIRVSIVTPGGEVIFDNNANIGKMGNHLDREEIKEALATGSGQAVRKSTTLEKSLYYHAILLEDGNVLRTAREVNNILSIFYRSVPVIFVLVIALFTLCLLVARYFTRKLVEPIEYLANNLDENKRIETYSELTPFMNTICKQHEDIIKGARMRQDFTANVTHELKTPLTSISGYSELIENGMATDADVQRFAREIHKNSSRLLTLINDIIRLSELDATDMSHAFEAINLYPIVEACVNMLQINAEKHKVSITFEGKNAEVMSTKEMMEELVYNLCDNAIRYNNENGMVHVSLVEEADKVVLSVKDTGIGIPKDHQERVFERFYRVDKSRSKSTGGTGLGLAIVKHIVVQSNAEIALQSEKGSGTEIKIIFPKIKEKE
jgi:two-component system phosphate regulon sensor histidine kinase PhoR